MSAPMASPAAPRWLVLAAYSLRALWRRRTKSLALATGLVLAVALVAAVLFLSDGLLAESDRARVAMPDVTVQRLIGGRPTVLSEADLSKLEGIPSVRSITPRVWGYLFVASLQGNVTVIGVRDGQEPLGVAQGSLEELRANAEVRNAYLIG